eukprot:CAMPEP_0177294524 /NCGR_PEP_ID=MMETSP0368-20130122/1371_1 /TAXON_ID=447022 ORGANISM="Scrippsiella hangoei-like, Strain SHHI-4" /NCGR_SAMPLE_ID=MMETSP0368 /ASSEMBLY_ACC=CAM_ASM_000363 /LENGTH=129 /DNA_ID=CAMNT_0018752461 /DNA_START=846 /DNA_END=1235 /DNA_ORIENTATION=-
MTDCVHPPEGWCIRASEIPSLGKRSRGKSSNDVHNGPEKMNVVTMQCRIQPSILLNQSQGGSVLTTSTSCHHSHMQVARADVCRFHNSVSPDRPDQSQKACRKLATVQRPLRASSTGTTVRKQREGKVQ